MFFDRLADICHELLMNDDKLKNYLIGRRGLRKGTIKTYKLGAFPKDLRDLYLKYNLEPEELKKHNIIWNANKSQFQMFPIVIPIRNIRGNAVAIGCRTVMKESERKKFGIPKYRNSSYTKSAYLYGLDRAVKSIRREDKVFVVEGYFDVISSHQAGHTNVVATCGTMLSKRQLIMLSRYTNNINLLYDNDVPGRECAKKVMSKVIAFDKNININCHFTPPGYKDLDEYLKSGGQMNIFENTIDFDNIRVEDLFGGMYKNAEELHV